jgi:2-methylisocitrate lyase-like PEP mutase family enzyme
MMTKFQQFSSLHSAETPFLLGNVWNAQSAKVYENLGYNALGTSSYAVAASLGYSDGQTISFDDYLFVVRHILNAISLPLSVDIEFGETLTAF